MFCFVLFYSYGKRIAYVCVFLNETRKYNINSKKAVKMTGKLIEKEGEREREGEKDRERKDKNYFRLVLSW